eukprot:3456227-Pyramimonas_sp.AAC.1
MGWSRSATPEPGWIALHIPHEDLPGVLLPDAPAPRLPSARSARALWRAASSLRFPSAPSLVSWSEPPAGQRARA